MNRPCTCDRLPPPGEPYAAPYCRLCWLYHHDPAYREFWDGAAPEPSFWEKAKTFAGAVVRHAADGMKHVGEEEYRRRIALCVACEFWRDGWCNKCGCRLAGDKVAKARWASEACPIGKW